MSVNGMFRKPHADSTKAERAVRAQEKRGLLSRSQAKRDVAKHSKACGVSALYEEKNQRQVLSKNENTEEKHIERRGVEITSSVRLGFGHAQFELKNIH